MGMGREDNYTIEVVDLSDATAVNAAASNTQLLQPPVGFVYEVIDVGYSAANPAGSGSGTHQIYMEFQGALSDMIRVKGNFGSAVEIAVSGFIGNNNETPAAIADQMRMMHHELFASNSVPLDCTYTNNTDVQKTGTRSLIFVVKKYREAV